MGITDLTTKQYRSYGLLVAIFIVFFTTLNPTKLPLVGLILGYVLLTLVLFTTIYGILKLLNHRKLLSRRHLFYVSAASTGIPMLLVVLQSIGQLTAKDLLGFLAIFSLGYLYVSRFSLHDQS